MRCRQASTLALLAVGLWMAVSEERAADEPAKESRTAKPPWQRNLQGEDAKKTAELAKQLDQLHEAGKFADALKAAEELAELRSQKQGADHWQAVNARLVVEAIRCELRQGKEEQTAYASCLALQRQANTLEKKGRHKEAQPLREKTLAIRRKVLGEEHPDTASSHNLLAINQHAQGKYKVAEAGFRKALTIRRKVLGEEHPDTARSYNNVAANLIAQGKYQEASEGLRKALALRRKVLGEEHPDTAQSYNNLAFNQNAQGKYAEAESLWLCAADSFAKVRLRIAASGLERAAKTSEDSPLPALAAVLARNGKPEDAWQHFEESLARGTWDDLSARLRRPAADQAKQTQLVNRLNRLDQLIEKTFSAQGDTPERRKRREDLLTQRRQGQEELDSFQRSLEEKYGPVAGQIFERKPIQASLPADTALIGWLDLAGAAEAADPNGEHWAVLLRSTGDPVWLRLRGSGPKDAWTNADTALPADLRAALQTPRGDWQPLARRLRQQRLEPLAEHLKGVRHLVVLPSTALAGLPVEVLADDYTVSYALSGTLHAHLHQQPKLTSTGLLALADPIFEPLAVADKPAPLPPGGVLLTMVGPRSNAALAGLKPTDVMLRYHGADLARPADLKLSLASPDAKQDIAVTVWRDGTTFELQVRPGKLGVVLADLPAPQALAEQRKLDRRLASATRGGDGKWEQLPGTRAEVDALRRLFGEPSPKLLTDSEASEQQLYALAKDGELGRYRYLHLATHGEVKHRFPLRSALILSRDALPEAGQQLDAGLPVYDGRLTAEEVLRQWHLNSELVTLSACQTALGKHESGEGFVGFAQALILSGSRGVCLSLWKVDDAATALLMERFYQNVLGKRDGLSKPLGKSAALAEAKAWLRGLSREEAVKRTASLSNSVARGKGRPVQPLLPAAPTGAKDDRPYAHPYYWAAFVLIGDPD